MKRTYILIPAFASVMIVGVVVAALWVMGSASGERAKFSSLEVAPRDADVFLAINTDPTSPQWLAVNDSLDSINAKDALRKAIDEALADVDLEWDRDIAPVAGDEAFFSIPDITEIGNDHGWDAGVLLNDPQHAREVFDKLRAQEDAEPLTEEDYNGVTIYVTDVSTSLDSQSSESEDNSTAFDYEPIFDCGGFGVRADGTPDEDAFGGEPCESDAQYCLWHGFVPTGDPDAPYDTAPCEGTGSYCGNYGLFPTSTPSTDGLPCGDDFDYYFEEPDFGDDPIFVTAESTPSTAAIAFVGNVLALGASADDVKAVIDVAQGRAESAEANQRLQDFRAHQKEDFLVWGYTDLADIWDEAEKTIPDSAESTGVDTTAAIDQLRATYDRVGFSLSSMPEGFAFDLTVVHSPDFDQTQAFEPTKAYEPAIAEVLPADTMFYLSAFDLYNQSWLPAKEQMNELELGDGSSLETALGKFRRETGLDLDTDVLSLLTGELAIAGNVANFEDPEVSLYGIADVNDETKAEDTMQALGDYLLEQNLLKKAANGDVSTWILENEDTKYGKHIGWYVRDGRLFAAYPRIAVDDIAPDGPTLSGTEDWKRTIELLPADKTSFGYVSIGRILEELRQTGDLEDTFAESTDGDVTLQDLEAIRSIGMASTASDDGFGLHFVLFMKDE